MSLDPDRPDVRRSPDGGSLDLSFRTGSRAHGTVAAASHAYITRSCRYHQEDRDPVVYTESGSMPAWAAPDPQVYWEAADLYERANGRLFVSAEFALPRELSPKDQRELAVAFAHDLTDPERLPYTMAIHTGLDSGGRNHNPHVHLMFSERQHDDLDRTAETWFKRANRQEPERGGRRRVAPFMAGTGSIRRAPSGRPQDRVEAAMSVEDLKQAIQDLDRDIAALVGEWEAVTREIDAEERPRSPSEREGGWGDRGDDSSRGKVGHGQLLGRPARAPSGH